MTDELKKLRDGLQNAPAPDMDAKAAALRVAEENFASLQENDGFTRPTETPAQQGSFLKGLKSMFSRKSIRPLLLTTSSIVVIGVGYMLVQPNLGPAPETFTQPSTVEAERIELNDIIIAQEPSIAMDMASEQTPTEAAPAPTLAPSKERRGGIVAPKTDTMTMASPEYSGMIEGNVRTTIGSLQPTILPVPSDPIILEPETRDRFANEAPNPLKITTEEPVSTFSIDVDTASYAWVRRSLQNGRLPDPNAVRVEEMINYFPYAYPTPEPGAPFQSTVTVTQTPWNTGTQLVHIGIQGEMPATDDRPPLNLVFLIDTSGSMSSQDKLPLLIQSFRLMLGELRPQDQVAIVTYAGNAGTVLEPTPASETAKINAALNNLHAGGSTAGEAGLRQAYALAEDMAEDSEISRVILATDGDFNVGMSGTEEMKRFIENKRNNGTYLSVLGFGRGNLNDALMQTLAQNGNGQAAYIDTLSEARKVLVDQLTGALFPIAGDVKIQIEFNPATVAEYRLIGYETRALRREDFNNDKVDAGDIGAGHTVTAIYEVTPVGSSAVLNDPLRYSSAEAPITDDELGFLRLRYKSLGEEQSQLIETAISPAIGNASNDVQFSTAIAGFGQLLRGSDMLGNWSYADAITLANTSKGSDDFGYRAEAVTLMRLAESLSKAQ